MGTTFRVSRIICAIILVIAFLGVIYLFRHGRRSEGSHGRYAGRGNSNQRYAHHHPKNIVKAHHGQISDGLTGRIYSMGAAVMSKFGVSKNGPHHSGSGHHDTSKWHHASSKRPYNRHHYHHHGNHHHYYSHDFHHHRNYYRHNHHHHNHPISGYSKLFIRDSPQSILKREEEYDLPKNSLLSSYRNLTQNPENVTFCDVAADNPYLEMGGIYRPEGKVPRAKVAIIVPYRRRWYHLRMLLHYIHPVLQRQGLEYGVFIINQNGTGVFNKASLMNAGFLEVSKLDEYKCFVFHDVDLMPEDYRCMYTCSPHPAQVRHIATSISKYRYRHGPGVTIGGISAFTKRQMQTLNGWSNLFKGWGGEDDDMALRIMARKMKIRRPTMSICRFTSLPHQRDKGNPLNPNRFRLLHTTASRMKTDGLNSVKYEVLSMKKYATYTNITVNIL
ncbi:beta-1,4-galactosyltransferase 4-like [Clavelina lepadiformis]|uniref:beta-1,4-galactosyltransferase 4-like n=1 Tax=Clavelina lepadiformis TaxID=159417 RepID=UPI004042C4A1